jgi:predicted DNA-binding transcriptional regulator YafY
MEMMRDRFDMMIVWSHAAGRYIFDPPHEHLPVVRLEPDEDEVLKLIKRLVPAFAGPVQIDVLNRVLTKLSLIAGGSNSFAREAGHGVVSPFAAMTAEESRFLQVLGTARDLQQELCVQYQSAEATAPTARVVHPLEFGYFKQRWIVFVHYVKRNKPVTLRLDRIHGAQPTGLTFARPTDYDPVEMLRGNLGAYTGNEHHVIRLRLRDHAASDARTRKWHASQTKVECADGRLEITLHLNNLVDILHDVLFWGAQVEVLSPPELRTRVEEELQAALAIYSK